MTTTAQLARAREVNARMLGDTCTIRRLTLTRDDAGGHLESRADFATVACRLAGPDADTRRLEAEAFANRPGWVVSMPYLTDVRVGDHLRMVGRTRDLEVVGMLTSTGTWATLTRVIAVEVQPT